jgi:hypothetical protein
MKSINYWTFEESLNEAIETLLFKCRSADSGLGSKFSNIDYGGAIARLLYTSAHNDDLLRRYFERIVEGGEKPLWALVPSDLSALARELLPIWGASSTVVIGIPTKRQLHRYLFYFPWLLNIWMLLKRLMNPSLYSSNVLKIDPSILCLAHHKKFVGLIRTIAVKTGSTYAFLVRDKREQVLLDLGDDEVVYLSSSPYKQLKSGFKSNWPDILNLASRFDDMLLKIKPKILIYCEGDAWPQDLFAHTGKKYLIPSICMQWGAYPSSRPRIGFRHMGCTAFLTWGDYFGDQLKSYNTETQFISVGHPGLELGLPEKINRRIIFLLNTDPNGKVTGLDAFHEQFWALLQWVAENADGWEIIVRMHPMIPLSIAERDLLSRFKCIQLHDPANKTLMESLNKCDLALTVSSSSVIEAAACGVIPFILNPAPWSFKPEFYAHRAGFEFDNVPLAIERLKALMLNPGDLLEIRGNLIEFRKKLFLTVGDSALNNIVAAINSLIISSKAGRN